MIETAPEVDVNKSLRTLDQIPLIELKGVGPSISAKLAAISINNVQDLLFHLPLRYQDRTRITPIARVRLGHEVLVEGTIVSCEIQFGKRRSLICNIRDGSGILGLRFFHFSAAQKKFLSVGTQLRCYGEARHGKTGIELYHPEYQIVTANSPHHVEDSLTPIYPTTEGLQQPRLRSLVEQALKMLESNEALVELLPDAIRSQLEFVSLTDAIKFLHHPPRNISISQIEQGRHPAQRRLAFEELISHRLCLRRLREKAETLPAPRLANRNNLTRQFLDQLPFRLTAAQQRVVQEISSDLVQDQPMLRLLQGDVGSGKTVVAALAALQAVENGYQAVIMAPTEILAEQHFANFCSWLAPMGIHPGWLSGKLKGKKRQQQLQAFADGDAKIIIGTHALFQEGVEFSKLGLIVVDEQHRFGVHQRLALREKGVKSSVNPHQLVMTATPIPRTLAMSAYADLDCSVIDELPPGRTAVNTAIISNQRREQVIQRIHLACSGGCQAYWVCTLIEESEALQCQAAEVTAQSLEKNLPDVSVGLVHGRMSAAEKMKVMQAFKNGDIQLLVATTVIEVGVDVPNASLMVIENPERLGLAQLHQLRGRVGRGSIASHCLLLYQEPLSQAGKLRLGILRDSNDGFYIAEKDLQIRGPGQVLGTQQTGIMSFKVADISRDADLLDLVKTYSDVIIRDYNFLISPLINRWLGDREHFGNV